LTLSGSGVTLFLQSISRKPVKDNRMAKRKGFNLSEIIRDFQKAHKSTKATEALAAIRKAHPNQKINEGTFKSTFYKLVGGGKTRKVRRLKPSRNGSGAVHDGLTAALKFVRECGSVEAARDQLDAVGKLIAVAKEVD
jgi:hypothetical protein